MRRFLIYRESLLYRVKNASLGDAQKNIVQIIVFYVTMHNIKLERCEKNGRRQDIISWYNTDFSINRVSIFMSAIRKGKYAVEATVGKQL